MAVKAKAKPQPKPKQTKYAKGQGFLHGPSENANFILDAGRNGMNFLGSAANWLTGKKQSRPGRGVGDYTLGTPKPAKRVSSGGSFGPPKGSAKAPPAQEDPGFAPEEQMKSFAEYLAQANSMAGKGPDFSGLINQARQDASRGDARLAAMYSQLQNSYAADAPKIQGNYDASLAAQKQNAQQAQTDTRQGFENARQGQTEQFKQLGIQEAAGVLAANGAQAARDQSIANSNIATNAAAGENQTSQNRAAALTYNTQIGQAAGAEGASQRATLAQKLAQRIAEIQQQQAEASAQFEQNNVGLASTLADFDNAQAQRRMAGMPSVEDDLKNQLLAQQIMAQQLRNQNFGAAVDPKASYAQAQKAAQQAGYDPSDEERMSAFLKNFGMAKKIYGQ